MNSTLRAFCFLPALVVCPLIAQVRNTDPQIKKIDPVVPQRGDQITVSGEHFGRSQGVIWIGTSPAVVKSWGDDKIEAKVPDDATGGRIAVLRGDAPHIWSKAAVFVLPSPPVSSNGIVVNDVKVYDNATLQQMLDSARSRLASLQFIDQAGIAAHVGTIQGSTSQQSGFAFNVGGPPIPGTQMTANSGNTSTSNSQSSGGTTNSGGTTTTTNTGGASGNTEQLQVTSPSSTDTTSSTNGSSVTGPSTQVVTTTAQQNPVVPSVPTMSSVTLPSFSPSASNILNEQVQLNSEAAGLALLLEGSLTDQTFRVTTAVGDITLAKRRVTLGIPVSILPSDAFKGDAAEVLITVSAKGQLPPSITAILPQDKTFNVATINSKSVSLGAGIVTGVLSAGVNWLWQKQTYYIVQDQDTVAMQLPSDPATPNEITFGWQLRPVLGRKTVSSGMRTLFVQLALPVTQADLRMASVTVRTRWKKVNTKTNVVSDVAIADSSLGRKIDVPVYDLSPDISNVDASIDNGDGTVTVRLETQSVTSGTYVKIGGSVITQTSSNAVYDPTHIDFTLPASTVANNLAYLVSRAGDYKVSRAHW